MKKIERIDEFKKFIKEEGFLIEEDDVEGILCSIQLGYPVLAVGPTGSGKTHFFELLAKFYGGSYEYASLNGSVTIQDLTQERILSNKGTFEEKDMVLARWLREGQKGISVLQLDEVNAAKPETLLALHPIMDIKGELGLPYSNETLKVNKDCILVMSCNEGDEYAGINAMNMAFQNRFMTFHFPYIQGKELAELLTNKTDVPMEHALAVVATWEKYMGSRDPEQPVVSIRVLERWCQMSHYLGLRKSGKIAFAGLIAKDKDEITQIVEGDFFVNLPRR